MNSALSKNEGFQGTLSNIKLIDLLQMTCLSRISINIRVEGEGKEGVIQIFNGNIVHAESGEKEGEEAFFEIMSWKGGKFQTFAMTNVPQPTIKKNWEFLLIEATKVQDETAKETSPRKERKPDIDPSTIKILIVDDSRLICRKLKELIETDPRLKVVGYAQNGKEALKKIRKLDPDLITLDINMPVMSGDTALKHIMIQSPCPVLIISSIDEGEMSKVMDFFRLGAVDFVPKPKAADDPKKQFEQLISKINIATEAKVERFKRCKLFPEINKDGKLGTDTVKTNDPIVVLIGSSGSYAECMKIIPNLNSFSGGALTALWADELLTKSLAGYINSYSLINVIPCIESSTLQRNTCYVLSLKSTPNIISTGNAINFSGVTPHKTWEDAIHDLVNDLNGVVECGASLTWVILSGEKRIPEDVLNSMLTQASSLLVQDPKTAMYPDLPEAIIETVPEATVLPCEKVASELTKILS